MFSLCNWHSLSFLSSSAWDWLLGKDSCRRKLLPAISERYGRDEHFVTWDSSRLAALDAFEAIRCCRDDECQNRSGTWREINILVTVKSWSSVKFEYCVQRSRIGDPGEIHGWLWKMKLVPAESVQMVWRDGVVLEYQETGN